MRMRMLVWLISFHTVTFFEVPVGNSQPVSPPRFVTIGEYRFACFVFLSNIVPRFFTVFCICSGAVFTNRLQADYETAFKLAIETINNDNSILPNTELTVIVNKTATLDAFKNIEMGKW